MDDVEVREIICGVSTTEEIQKFHERITEQHLKNQENFNSGVISMDIEDVKASYYDFMRMAGKIVISKNSQPFQRHLDDRMVTGLQDDERKQTPGKIIFGDGLTWWAIISLPYRRNRNGDYKVERIRPQPRILQVLRDLPVCTGVGVRRDEVGIEDFYSIISGEAVEFNGFLDLSGMAAAAGF